METIIVRPKPPYNIKTHFEHYGLSGPQPHTYEDGVYRRAIRLINGKLIPFEIELNDDVKTPKLKIVVYQNLTDPQKRELIDKIKWSFCTEYDLKPLYEFMEADPILRRVKNNNYGLRPAYFNTVYEGTITVIVQQQISLKIAGHMTSLIIEKYGDCIKSEGKEFREFPSPGELANATIEGLRKCKLSGRKAEYIMDFSRRVAEGKLNPESLKNRNHQEITETLTSFRGLGRWTAEMVIVTAISVENMNPAGDLGARKTISHFYNNDKLLSEEEVRRFTEKWGRYKGIITYYLIGEYLHR